MERKVKTIAEANRLAKDLKVGAGVLIGRWRWSAEPAGMRLRCRVERRDEEGMLEGAWRVVGGSEENFKEAVGYVMSHKDVIWGATGRIRLSRGAPKPVLHSNVPTDFRLLN